MWDEVQGCHRSRVDLSLVRRGLTGAALQPGNRRRKMPTCKDRERELQIEKREKAQA